MAYTSEEIGKLDPRALTELMRTDPSPRLYELGSAALSEMAQAQMTPYGVDSVLFWRAAFQQAYDGYRQAEVLGFQES